MLQQEDQLDVILEMKRSRIYSGKYQLEESGNDTQAAVNTAVISNGNLGKTRWHSLN